MSTHPSDEMLQRHLDGALETSEAQAVERHLAGCADCTALRAEYAELFRGLAVMEQPEPPPAFAQAVMARVDVHRRDVARQRAVAAATFAGSVALALGCFAAAGSHVWAHEVSAWSAGLVSLGRGLHLAFDVVGSLAVALRLPLMAVTAALSLPLVFLLYRTLPERTLPASA